MEEVPLGFDVKRGLWQSEVFKGRLLKGRACCSRERLGEDPKPGEDLAPWTKLQKARWLEDRE